MLRGLYIDWGGGCDEPRREEASRFFEKIFSKD